jgi:hypothetical protein
VKADSLGGDRVLQRLSSERVGSGSEAGWITAVIVRYGLAGVLATIGFLTSSCAGQGAATAPPPSHLVVKELAQHDEKFCPKSLPQASRRSYGFGNDRAAARAPRLQKPQEAWLCEYGAKDVGGKNSNGAWYKWQRHDPPRRLDADQLTEFSTAIEELKPPTGGRACTADLGPRFLVSYSHDDDLTGVVIDDYGCHEVRLTDDPFTTIPGEPSEPGTVAGVLTGPAGLLHDLDLG